MKYIMYKHYDKMSSRDDVISDLEENSNNDIMTIAFVSGEEKVMDVIKKLIKDKYCVE